MKNRMVGPQKIKNSTTIGSGSPTSGYMSNGNENRISETQLHTQVHGSMMHNIQDTEASKCSLTEECIRKMGHTSCVWAL